MSGHLSKRGGLSVFLCLVLSAVILLIGTLAQAAQIRAAEHAGTGVGRAHCLQFG